MKRFLTENCLFLALLLVAAAAMGAALLLVPQTSLHLWLNSGHTPFGDVFCRYYTLVAEYGIAVAALLLIFFAGAGDTLQLLAAEAGAGLTCQLIKHIVHAPRPVTVFSEAGLLEQLPLVAEVRMRLWNSFPSGHTSTFFVLCFTLCLLWNRHAAAAHKKETYPVTSLQVALQVALFAAALLGGYSRIYLSQHFAADVLAGMLIGSFFAALSDFLFRAIGQRYPRFSAWHIAASIRRTAPHTPA
ncbi:MAG: phosphatase PAP2 family protein [Paludibacteraceae bacterium]|nr:phosphatase PAP2 family protein [Paludibacteraceae bacterium]MBQ9706233.1 phosphatase PAP2 family protein [Paludibacteraceae bacterium]